MLPTEHRWRSCPVFISSTFENMHFERDFLANEVMPELAERARAFAIHLARLQSKASVVKN